LYGIFVCIWYYTDLNKSIDTKIKDIFTWDVGRLIFIWRILFNNKKKVLFYGASLVGVA